MKTSRNRIDHQRTCKNGPPSRRRAARPVKKAGIDKTVLKARAAALLEQPIAFMYNPEFEQPRREAEILGPVPETPEKKPRLRAPAGLPAYLASLYEVPLLTKPQEVHYFRKMNYLKFRAARLRDRLDPRKVKPADLDRIDGLLNEATRVTDVLVRSNLRLVVSLAKKFSHSERELFEAVSDGNVSLMRAVDKFDYGRGFKFSTYAVWAIRRNFARTVPAEQTQLKRFHPVTDEVFQHTRDKRTSQFAEELVNRQQREALAVVLDELPKREREIIELRFGLVAGTEALTLEQVGRHFGVSKERVRQLQVRALRKLREIVERDKHDALAV